MTIMELVQKYGLDSVIIAVAVCIITGLVKTPIKRLAAKTKDSSKYTKYITFLPLILGFGVTALYEYILTNSVSLTGDFISLWFASSSLSLAIYAFIEKFIPSKKKILSAEEIRRNEDLLDSIKGIITPKTSAEETEKGSETEAEVEGNKQNFAEPEIKAAELQISEPVSGTIILRGKKHD